MILVNWCANPTPRTLSCTPFSGVRHVQEIEPAVLSQILQFAFWMRKTGYRDSTVHTRVRTLKGLARRTNLLDTESVKSYLANAKLSENSKTKQASSYHPECPYRSSQQGDVASGRGQGIQFRCRVGQSSCYTLKTLRRVSFS